MSRRLTYEVTRAFDSLQFACGGKGVQQIHEEVGGVSTVGDELKGGKRPRLQDVFCHDEGLPSFRVITLLHSSIMVCCESYQQT